MKVLISPNETVLDPNTNEAIGARLCDIVDVEFEVASPLFWADCPEGVSSSTHFYDLSSSTFGVTPEYIPPPEPPQPISQGAQTL